MLSPPHQLRQRSRAIHLLEPKGTRRSTRMLELEASRNTYLDLYVNAPVPFLTLGPAGKIERVNHAAVSLLCESAGGLVRRSLERFVAPGSIATWRDHMKEAKSQHDAASAIVCLLVAGRAIILRAASTHL